jgi:hypothetical protein
LNYHNSQTSFTPYVPEEKLRPDLYGHNSGTNYMALDIVTMNAETDGREGNIYEITVIKTVDRLIDLDKACKEQNIEPNYLKICPDNPYNRNLKEEVKLQNLYGKKMRDKRIHGVLFSSRRAHNGKCILIYDTLTEPEQYFFYKLYTTSDK